ADTAFQGRDRRCRTDRLGCDGGNQRSARVRAQLGRQRAVGWRRTAPPRAAQPDLLRARCDHASADLARPKRCARAAEPGDRLPPRAARSGGARRVGGLPARATWHQRARAPDRSAKARARLVRSLAARRLSTTELKVVVIRSGSIIVGGIWEA